MAPTVDRLGGARLGLAKRKSPPESAQRLTLPHSGRIIFIGRRRDSSAGRAEDS